MMRRVLASLAVLGVVVVLAGGAEDKPKPPAAKAADTKVDLSQIKDGAALKQAMLAQQFRDFEQSLLRLAQRLEKSPKPEDREKAVLLRKAIKLAGDEAIDSRFDKLVGMLKSTKIDKNVEEVRTAIAESEKVTADLRAMIALLLSDSAAAQRKEEMRRLGDLIKELNKVLRDEKMIRAQNERGKIDPNAIAKAQAKTAESAQNIAKAMGGEGKNGGAKGGKTPEAKGTAKGAGKEGAKGAGEGKNDTKDPKGAGKEGGKSGEPGKGDPSKSGEGAKGAGKGEGNKAGGDKAKSGEGKNQGDKAGDKNDPGKGKGEGNKGDPKKGDPTKGDPTKGDPTKGDPSKSGSKSASKGEGKGKADGKGEAKSGGSKSQGAKGEGKGKGSPSKSGGQPQQGQPKESGDSPPPPNGDPKAQPPGGPQQPPTPGKKKVQDAIEAMKRAEDALKKAQKEGAAPQIEKAIKDLEDAKAELERLLKQLREEEIERLLAALQARCERMLQMQIEVYEGTVRVDRSIGENPDRKPNRGNDQKSQQLSDREGEIVLEANKAINLLEAEGSAVAFPQVFEQVRDDMKNVQRRLNVTDVGVVTQAIEQDIIASLKEMIEALKKQQQQMQAQKGQPMPSQGQPQDQKLIDLLAELKMIRSMQIRINTRTETYGRSYKGEQADAPEIQKELKNLADREKKITKVTKDIAEGKNQ